jgi:hypothetical protein
MAAPQSRPEECHLFLRLTQIKHGLEQPCHLGAKTRDCPLVAVLSRAPTHL